MRKKPLKVTFGKSGAKQILKDAKKAHGFKSQKEVLNYALSLLDASSAAMNNHETLARTTILEWEGVDDGKEVTYINALLSPTEGGNLKITPLDNEKIDHKLKTLPPFIC